MCVLPVLFNLFWYLIICVVLDKGPLNWLLFYFWYARWNAQSRLVMYPCVCTICSRNSVVWLSDGWLGGCDNLLRWRRSAVVVCGCSVLPVVSCSHLTPVSPSLTRGCVEPSHSFASCSARLATCTSSASTPPPTCRLFILQVLESL